ncbi:glycine betaine/L-proline ABC transporter ATP-binding protein ProV [Halothermothrix orenii]|uniref:Quaternary amine transport ATP-binding protein n=1 Tax=Halothermothrix orenii (strain H 168 / OCM 544 / DSM 9562) TaxID=373903 RepID=B8D0G0_HALOH|nr:glycine betaine/L-proline ABC transporter ATP-binding protein ProV [Halothermothrix orenii]ACL70896.1 glycine betaine/L-proline ABC transporter, ATPase subunit [Halothermothrix orenii H 168]
MAKIQVKNLYKIFGPKPHRVFPLLEKGLSKEEILEKTGHTIAVNNASFSVEKGEIFVVMGLSGSGKSTLVRCINRLIEPTRGQIIVDEDEVTGADMEKLREIRRHKIGMVFQHFALFPHRTVLENVEYGLEVQGVPEEERREQSLKALVQVGLEEWASYNPGDLSGGMQQRVGLARALATDPDILLMDEAFSALDPLIRRDMQNELLDLQAKLHKTIVFITHDLDEALRMGDRIAIMKDGQIVQTGSPEEILSEPANDYVANFVRDVNKLKVLKAEDVMIRPDALIHAQDGPRMALRIMDEEGFNSVYVVDHDKRVVGIIEDDKALEARKKGETNLKDYLITDFPKATPDTPLTELLPIASETKYPVAVVNDDNRLTGIIVRISVLSALAEGGEEDV